MNLADLILPVPMAGGRPPKLPGDPFPQMTPVQYQVGKGLALLMSSARASLWASYQSDVGNNIGFAAAGPLSDGRYYVIGEMVSDGAIGEGGLYTEGFSQFGYTDLEFIEVIPISDLPMLLISTDQEGA